MKKGLFSVKHNNEEKMEEIIKTPLKEKITYQNYGFLQASNLGGTIAGLRVSLQKIYFDFKQEVKDDFSKQEELKKPYRVKIEDHKGDIERLKKKIEKVKTEYIPAVKLKVRNLKEELSNIKKNPQEITGDDAGRASFFIGGIILTFLTVYLFVFYSSASYSTFFKEFTLSEIGVVNSIFDAQALSKALDDGFTELLLILTIPFVFLGLGYLIHKFQEQKGFGKYLKTAMLIFITFIFDIILAYEITEKIYNIKKENSFDDIPNYSISMAFESINFWLIIFAGFIVYIIWGFVFDFVMEAYGKMDKVKIALKEKEKEITDSDYELKDFDIQIDKMTHSIAEHSKEINKLVEIIDKSIIPREFEHDIFSFLSGWMSWMKQCDKPHSELDEANSVTQEFVNITLYNFENINAN